MSKNYCKGNLETVGISGRGLGMRPLLFTLYPISV